MLRPALVLVEDDEIDTLVLRRAVRRAGSEVELFSARDARAGLELIEALVRERRAPRLVVLDVNLPGTSGHELLAALRSRATTRELAVFVWSTSARPQDVAESARLGALRHLTKGPGVVEEILWWLAESGAKDRRRPAGEP